MSRCDTLISFLVCCRQEAAILPVQWLGLTFLAGHMCSTAFRSICVCWILGTILGLQMNT